MSTTTRTFDGQTIGQLVDDIAEIAKTGDRHAARAYFDAYRDWIVAAGHPATNAEANIGYASGYCDPDTAKMIRDVFDVSHPIFGRETPSAEKALEAGKRAALGEFNV